MNYSNSVSLIRFFYYRKSVPVAWFVLALLVSFLSLVIYPANPLEHPDALSYHTNASHLLQHGEIRDAFNELRAWRPPGATIFFAGIYKLSGINPNAIVIVQIVLFALVVALLSDATTKITNSIQAGHTAGAFALLINSYYNYSVVLLSEQLHLFFLATSLWLLVVIVYAQVFDRVSARNISVFEFSIVFALGLSVGLATVVKSYLFYFPIYLLVIMFLLSALKWILIPSRSWKLFGFGLFAFLVVISPFLLRNYLVIGSATKLVTYGGYNLFLGNYSLIHGDWLTSSSHVWYAEIDEKMSLICSSINDEVGRDLALTKAGLQIIKENFGLFILKFFTQSIKMLTTAGAKGIGIEKFTSIVFYVICNIIAIAGMFFSYKLYKPIFLAFLIFGSYVIIIFSVTFSAPRLNMPLTIMLPTLCAVAIRGYLLTKCCVDKVNKI
jgi:hypothetical protein